MQLYLWLTIILLVPFIAFSFTKKLLFYKDIYYVLPAIIIPSAFFILIDYFFMTWGVFGFNSQYLTGSYWFGLPMEVTWYYVAVSYSCLFLYAFTKRVIEKEVLRSLTKIISACMLLLTLVLFFAFRKQLYTAIAALICIFLLTIRTWVARPKSLARFYLAYLVCLVPVFLIYGILTSIGALWYEANQIVGIKIAVIPLENALYFLALFLMNVGIYDYLKNRKEEIKIEVVSALS